MNGVMQWATVVCLAAVVGAMIELITPTGRMEKMVRFVLGGFMICAIITPLTGTATKITFDLPAQTWQSQETAASFQEDLNEQVLQVAANNIKELAVEALQKEHITAQKIEVFMDTSDESGISINNLVVTLDESRRGDQAQVKKILENTLGLPTEVSIDER